MSLSLLDVRAAVTEALAPVNEGDPPVIGELPEQVEPPALMFLWDSPWLRPLEDRPVMGGTSVQLEAAFRVRCVASRLTPGVGVEALEGMIDHALARLEAAAGSWLLQSVSEPHGRRIADEPRLVADAVYRVPVTLERRLEKWRSLTR